MDPVTVDHEDVLTLSQRITATGDGLLAIALTVDDINLLPRRGAQPGGDFQRGDNYQREEIRGHSQQFLLTIQGEVKEATGLPHFSSLFYYPTSMDAVAFDMYRVFLMLYPQFPPRFLEVGNGWKVENKVTVKGADTGYLGADLNVVVDRKTTYTLRGFAERKGYRTAHITFKSEYGFEASSLAASEDFFSDGIGEDVGELYFAPEEGIVVEASIESKPIETKSQGGEMVMIWLDGQTRTYVNLREGHTTVPLKWYTNKTISFERAEQR